MAAKKHILHFQRRSCFHYNALPEALRHYWCSQLFCKMQAGRLHVWSECITLTLDLNFYGFVFRFRLSDSQSLTSGSPDERKVVLGDAMFVFVLSPCHVTDSNELRAVFAPLGLCDLIHPPPIHTPIRAFVVSSASLVSKRIRRFTKAQTICSSSRYG